MTTKEGIYTPLSTVDDDLQEFIGRDQRIPAQPQGVLVIGDRTPTPAPVVANGEPVLKPLDPNNPEPMAAEHTLNAETVDRLSEARVVFDNEISGVRDCADRLRNAQVQARVAEQELQRAARVIEATEKPVTPADLARDFAAGGHQARIDAKNGVAPRPRSQEIVPGPSALDRSRAIHSYEPGDGANFVRKQLVTGAARGALPAKYQGVRIPPKEPAA